jgi:hypothetical protein
MEFLGPTDEEADNGHYSFHDPITIAHHSISCEGRLKARCRAARGRKPGVAMERTKPGILRPPRKSIPFGAAKGTRKKRKIARMQPDRRVTIRQRRVSP